MIEQRIAHTLSTSSHVPMCRAGAVVRGTDIPARIFVAVCLRVAGFFGMLLAYLVCGLTVPYLTHNRGLFYLVYGLSFFFCNLGPNVTTFVIPSELFPTAIRASAHGISAASGKLGAALGTAVMPVLLSKTSLATVLYVSAAISALGLLFTAALTVESSNINLVRHRGGLRAQQRAEAADGSLGAGVWCGVCAACARVLWCRVVLFSCWVRRRTLVRCRFTCERARRRTCSTRTTRRPQSGRTNRRTT